MAVEIAGVPAGFRAQHRTDGIVLGLHVNRDGVRVVPPRADVWNAERHGPGTGNDAAGHISETGARFTDHDRLLTAAAPPSKALRIAEAKIDDGSRIGASKPQFHLQARHTGRDVERAFEHALVVVS